MRYVTFKQDGETSWGVLLTAGVLDVPAAAHGAGIFHCPNTLQRFIQEGPVWWQRVADLVAQAKPASLLPLSAVRLQAPLPRPARNVFALGLNYAEHAEEGGAELPQAPIYFTKATSAVIGPDEAIICDPSLTKELDWEVELGVVIGLGGRRIPESGALKHVFGYTVIHDVSARDLQFARGGQWFLGKSLDTTCPMGPWIVSADEIADPQALDLCLCVNWVEKQNSNTRHMLFPVATIIADLSSALTLKAGDIISTGTPSGVGADRTPPEFLQPGDIVEAEVGHIGVLRNPVAAPPP